MKFPNTLSDEIIMKAKAYSLLETFSLGGVELNPFTSLFINALKNSLMKFNPDLNEVYNQLYYSTTVGAGAYFEAGAEVSFSLMKDKCEFSLAEATLGTTFDLGLEIHHQDPHRHFNMNFAGEFSSGLLGFEFFNAIETGHVLSSSIGAKIFVEADYVKDSGFEDFGLGFEFSPTGSIVLDDYSSWNQLKFNIPMGVIQRNLQSENLIGFVSPFFYPSYDNQQLNLHPGKIVEYLDYYINDTPIELDDLDNYVTFSRYQSSKLGKSWDLSIDLTVALGIGAGVKLGIEYAFLDELKYPLTKYAIYKNKVLPIHKFEPLSDEDRLFTVTDEMYDLFHGAALLIKDPLQALQEKVDQAIEAGKEFALDVFNSTVKVAGVLSQPGKFVIRKISSALKRTKKSAFNGSEVINAYTSSNVVNLNGETNALMEGGETTLYIISDHYNISLLDESDNVIMEFDPVNLSIVTNPDIIAELNFTSEDLKNAKMYYYDDQNLTWMELEGDLNPAVDTVETLIGKSGTYAIGINYSTTMDIVPVEIVDYYPANLGTIQPDDTLWVRLYENPIGSGIDFTRSAIIIDGVEVDAEWNPVKNLLMFIPEEPMSDGEHSFAVNIYDNNNNYSNVFSVFKIASTFIDYSLVMDNRFRFECYPNPVSNTAIITINNPDDEEFARISIYNSKGELISVLHEGIIERGLNEIQISRNAIQGNEILPGIYFIKYENSRKSIVKKLIFR
jgi:hypothetical protein